MHLGVPRVALGGTGVRAVMLIAIMAARIAMVADPKLVADYVLQEGTRTALAQGHGPVALPELTAGRTTKGRLL